MRGCPFGGLIAEACWQRLRGKGVIFNEGVGSHPNSTSARPIEGPPGGGVERGAELGFRPEDMLLLGLAESFVL